MFDKTVFPGAGYAELALSAAREVFGKDSVRLEDIKFHAPLFLDDKHYSQVQTIVTLDEKGKAEIEIFSMNSSDNNWMLQASAKAKVLTTGSNEKFANIDTRNEDTILTDKFYEDAKKEGIDYREAFKGLSFFAFRK